MPHFNPMRVLDVGLAHDFAGREDAAPKDLESEPIIGTMQLGGEMISLHRFTSFVPTPDTVGQLDELPFLAGQGVGLIHDVMPVRQSIDRMVADAASALAAVRSSGGSRGPSNRGMNPAGGLGCAPPPRLHRALACIWRASRPGDDHGTGGTICSMDTTHRHG
jgi:hypothetical protein